MAHRVQIRVEYVGPLAAKLWREPDASFPHGQAYVVSHERILNESGDVERVQEGDLLDAFVGEQNEVETARLLSRRGI